MKSTTHIIIGLFILSIGTFCIGQQSDALAVNSSSSFELKKNTSDGPAEFNIPNYPCKRKQPHMILRPSVYPTATFELQEDQLSTIEEVDLDNGDHLTVRNEGCEKYILKFRFETTRFRVNSNANQFWYKNAYTMLLDILNHLDPQMELHQGIKAMNSYIMKEGRHIQPGKKIIYGPPNKGSSVVLDIESIDGAKYALTFTFTSNPF